MKVFLIQGAMIIVGGFIGAVIYLVIKNIIKKMFDFYKNKCYNKYEGQHDSNQTGT